VIERRWDPVSGEWRMFADHRQDRTFLPPDEFCPLCPTRPGGPATEIPMPAFDIAVFENRFPALVRRPPPPAGPVAPPFRVAPSTGANEVVVYTDDHHVGLADMDVLGVARVVDVWTDRSVELGRRDGVGYVFVFENRGVAVGVTLSHPHGQIYAYPDVPPRVRRRIEVAQQYFRAHGTCVHCDVTAAELLNESRIVVRNRAFVAYVPFAARFPFELHVVPLRHAPSFAALTDDERMALAELLQPVLRGYDRLFEFPLPYVMSVHQAPTSGDENLSISHLQFEFTPPHRTAQRLKYLAGSELGAGAFLNDTVPEETAGRLRAAVGD